MAHVVHLTCLAPACLVNFVISFFHFSPNTPASFQVAEYPICHCLSLELSFWFSVSSFCLQFKCRFLGKSGPIYHTKEIFPFPVPLCSITYPISNTMFLHRNCSNPTVILHSSLLACLLISTFAHGAIFALFTIHA